MAVYFGNTKLGAMQYAGHNITQISYLGKIYKLIDDVSITFIEAGVSTTVKYPIGATVSRNTAPSGASFVGWSRSSNGASPVATFTATESATYYRVVKYNDYTVYSSAGRDKFTKPTECNVDPAKYTLTLSGYGGYGGVYVVVGTGYHEGWDYQDDESTYDITGVFGSLSLSGNQSDSKSNIAIASNPFYARADDGRGGHSSGAVTAVGKAVVG